jgi:uncharacterized delta-60 repeat protein
MQLLLPGPASRRRRHGTANGRLLALPAHAEFTPAGQPDATVSPAAITTSSHGPGATFLASGGYVLATSPAVAKHDDDIQVQRFNADGSLAAASPAFDYSGATGIDQAFDSVLGVAVQPNGQIVVDGGHFAPGSGSPIGLARVNGNGSLDTAFGNGGTLTTTIQGDDGAAVVLIQPDGKIIAVGSSENNSTGETDVFLSRYLAS